MNLYVESSAVLAWLFDESPADEVRRLLAGADVIFASDLTLIECTRVLIRAVLLGELNEAEAAERQAHLH
jgi:predicted nucleic acid-binding protein